MYNGFTVLKGHKGVTALWADTKNLSSSLNRWGEDAGLFYVIVSTEQNIALMTATL